MPRGVPVSIYIKIPSENILRGRSLRERERERERLRMAKRNGKEKREIDSESNVRLFPIFFLLFFFNHFIQNLDIKKEEINIV